MIQVLEWMCLQDASEGLWDSLGGRVVPILFGSRDTSPFLLLAHHTHSFTPFDPFRALTTLFLPEGFPAHPHAGFSTLTMSIAGGLAHRDSEGLAMRYQDGDSQWMRAGRGTLHEEMWTSDTAGKSELYQLWINSPSTKKFAAPQVRHLLAKDTADVSIGSDCHLKVICGSVTVAEDGREFDGALNEMADTPVAVCQLTLAPDATLFVEAALGATFILYIRRGSVMAGSDGARVRMGDMVCFDSQGQGQGQQGQQGCAEVTAGPTGLSALLLLGNPIRENVVMGGPLVMENEDQYKLAASYFNKMGASAYWSHKLSDDEWLAHTRKLNLQGVIEEELANSNANDNG